MGMSKQLKRVVVTVTSVIMVASSVPVDALAQARDTAEPMTSAASAVVQGMTSQLLPQDTAAPTTQQDDKSVAPADTPATADSTSDAPSADSADATATDAATPGTEAAPQTDATLVETPAPAQAPAPKIDCGFGLAIVAVVMGNVIGIVALIYAVLASNMLQSGDYEGARRAAHTGKIWSWTAIILSAAALCLGMILLPRLVELIAPGLTDI